MNLKKTLSLILALIMAAATFGAIAIPAAAETAGTASSTGTADISWYEANPDATEFTISTADQLDGLAKLVNEGTCNFEGKTIKLGANIEYNSGLFAAAADGSALYNGQAVSETNMPRVWPIIGKAAMTTEMGNQVELDQYGDKIFHGSFDGCGYEISGLYVDSPSLFRVGLFAAFAGEELKNTIIRNTYFHGNGHVASFAGFLDRDEAGGVTLENLYSDAYIVTSFNGDIRSAGLVGQTIDILDLIVNRCAYEGNVIDTCADNNGRHRYIAGLIGRMDQANEIMRPATISNCLVNPTFTITNNNITKVHRWGGIIGDTRNCGASGITMKDCLVIINTKFPEVTYGEDGTTPVDFEITQSGANIGYLEHTNTITIDNVYAIINSDKFTNLKGYVGEPKVNKITFEGVTTEYSVKGEESCELATQIANPALATDLDASIFLLTENNAAIKDLNACFGGHSFTELYQAKAASCDGDGWSTHYRCNNCSKFFGTDTNEVAKETVIIPAAHEYGTLITGAPATCTENGTIDHYKCSLCNRTFNADKEEVNDLTILAGHTYGELVRRVKATCTEPGTKAHYQCSACNKYFDEEKAEVADITIPAAGHDYGKWVEAVAPTTSAAGVLGHYKCDECRKYFDADKNELASIEGEPKLTTTKKPDTTKTPATTAGEEKGCGGFAAVGSLLALIALSGAAIVIKKK